jgi:hypothetical protein
MRCETGWGESAGALCAFTPPRRPVHVVHGPSTLPLQGRVGPRPSFALTHNIGCLTYALPAMMSPTFLSMAFAHLASVDSSTISMWASFIFCPSGLKVGPTTMPKCMFW